MNTKTALGLSVGALLVGLLGGIAIANNTEPTKAPEVGPTKTVSGVPVGYERSRSGAASAALNYESLLGVLARPGTQRRDSAIAVMATANDRSALTKAVNEAGDLLDRQLGNAGVVRNAILGYRVTTYDQNQASVELWEVGVVGNDESIPAQAAWRTVALRLLWDDSDWKLASVEVGAAGPTPQLQGDATAPAELIKKVREQEDVRHVPLH